MAGKQHQLLAVLPGLQGAAAKIGGETSKMFAGKHGHFMGILKVYKPLEDDGEKIPEEGNSEVLTTVGEKLQHYSSVVAPFLDALLQVESTNQIAKGDIDVPGLVLKDVPATFLIQFDKKLNEIRNVLDTIPTLDPKRHWDKDSSGNGIYRGTPDITYRTKKTMKTLVRYEATPQHPAQTEVYSEDSRVGEYTTQHWSGMLTPQAKYEVIARLDTLQKAVKVALSRANDTEQVTRKVADEVFSYLFEGISLSRG